MEGIEELLFKHHAYPTREPQLLTLRPALPIQHDDFRGYGVFGSLAI